MTEISEVVQSILFSEFPEVNKQFVIIFSKIGATLYFGSQIRPHKGAAGRRVAPA